MICAGVDVGSITAKAAIFDDESQRVLGTALQLTGWSPREAGHAALHDALDLARLSANQIAMVVGTGYGRVSLPFVDETITEITCHARGAHYILPSVRTVIDIGGQDSKAISVDDGGHPRDFAMNDRCAAGTGRFLQVMAAALGVEVGELGVLSRKSRCPAQLSSVCTVFAESEVVGLIAAGATREDIAGGLCQSVAKRVAGMVTQVGVHPEVLLTGGVALNEGVVAGLEEALGVRLHHTEHPQLVGAVGAAIVACEKAAHRG